MNDVIISRESSKSWEWFRLPDTRVVTNEASLFRLYKLIVRNRSGQNVAVLLASS